MNVLIKIGIGFAILWILCGLRITHIENSSSSGEGSVPGWIFLHFCGFGAFSVALVLIILGLIGIK